MTKIRAAKHDEDEIEEERKFRSLSIDDHPDHVKSADGSTDLHRFEVKAIVYAPNYADAQHHCSQWNLGPYMDAAKVDPRPDVTE